MPGQRAHFKCMMQKICFFICLFASTAHAQSAGFQFYGKSIAEIRQSFHSPALTFRAVSALPSFPALQALSAAPDKEEVSVFFNPGFMQWKVEDLPFFCRIEHQVGKKLPLLFKFRLGSVEYVDWLEGKNRGER